MSIWLQAAKNSLSRTDKTDSTDRTPQIRAEVVKKPADNEVSSVLSVCQFDGHTPISSRSTNLLPNEAPICAVCGGQDWRVSIIEPDGRNMHVACSLKSPIT